jgi:predicted ribosome quality control (RQC) complex YloA/Tae2 family protein
LNEATIKNIFAELSPLIKGKRFGKIFPLSRLSMAVDLRLPDGSYLFLDFGTNPAPRIYLIKRRLKELEKQSGHPSSFVLHLRKLLSNAIITDASKFDGERIVRFDLLAEDELGDRKRYALIAQLTGRSANLFLLGADGRIIDSLRDSGRIGETYMPPDTSSPPKAESAFPQGAFAALSEALDAHYQKLEAGRAFAARAKSAVDEIKRQLKKREKLLGNLQKDIEAHGDVERHKRLGDLLLANPNAKVKNGEVTVIDFFDESMPGIVIGIEENLTPAQAAQNHFAAYTKARRALSEVPARIETVEAEVSELMRQMEELQNRISGGDLPAAANGSVVKQRERPKENISTGYRTFVSDDGFEILVGRGAKDNDQLTFRTGKSQDLWLHAADYPGSHVIVRNPNRKEIPQKTLLEAAQLAAFYSQAKKQPKAAVNYTQQKNVSKIKGGAPGLVRISTFKTIMVEPKKLEEK